MERVGCPRQLPRPEVRLATLLVQICKDEEQQDGNEPWDYRGSDDDTIHRVGVLQLARAAGSLSGGNSVPQWCHTTTVELNKI